MATETIGDYTAATTIDGSTHFLLIQPGSSSTAYKSINRNVFLGVTGQPMDISTTQTISNKIFANSNSMTIKDGSFTLQNSANATKQAIFSLSALSPSTTATYTLPGASDTLIGSNATQTLLNKTFTAPIINNGSIDNSTITVDAITGHTTPNTGSIYGISIVSSAIQSSSVFGAGVILPNALVNGTGTSWDWQSWTPIWNNLTVGDGTIEAKYRQIGKTIFGRVLLTFGTTTSISGAGPVSFILPVNSTSTTAGTAGMKTGNGSALIGGTIYDIFPLLASTTTLYIRTLNVASTYPIHVDLTGSIPSVWANTSILAVEFFYEAA